MRTLVLGTLFVGATSLASGCIFVSDDDDDPIIDDVGSIAVSWDLDPDCPVDDNTAELVAVDTATGEMFTDLVNCTDFSNTIDDLLPGTYDVSVNIVSDDRSFVYAVGAVEEDVLVTAGDTTVVDTFDILLNDAFFAFTWTLTEGAAPLDCADVPRNVACTIAGGECDVFPGGICDEVAGVCRAPSSGIDIAATLMDDQSLNATQFNCEDGEGVTQPFPLGDYTIVFAVLEDDNEDGEDLAIPESVTDPITDTLEVGNEIVDLGNVEFAF